VLRALEHVPYVYREILVLRYIEDMELDEISAALGLGGSATRMRLSRAREFFRQAYTAIT
jgi:RNA polymerase sigma-70 factor (ECF subfamily)